MYQWTLAIGPHIYSPEEDYKLLLLKPMSAVSNETRPRNIMAIQ